MEKELAEWKTLAQEFVDLFDPAKPSVSPALFRAVMLGVKTANASLRENAIKIREEVAMALTCLPSDDGIREFLDNAHPESEVTDLDNVEAGMELQDALAGARDALNVALTLLPKPVEAPP